MAIIKKQLKGDNLCNTSCIEQKEIIHPETDIDAVLMSEEDTSSISLKDWILGGGLPDTPSVQTSLKKWLQTYYNGEVEYILPTATSAEKGGIKVGQYLTINNEILSVNRNALSIPNEYILPSASHVDNDYVLGGVNIYTELKGKENPSDEGEEGISIEYGGFIGVEGVEEKYEYTSIFRIPIEEQEYLTFDEFYTLPVDIIKEGVDNDNIIVNIPKQLFEYDNIRNTPSLAQVALSGSYNDLTNKPTIPAAQVNSNWNAVSGVAQILNKPNLSVDRVIDSLDESSTVATTLYSGNPVMNLNSDNIEDVLKILLDKECPIKNITLYISEIEDVVTVRVENYPTLACYQNQSSVTYTDNGEDTFEFSFSSVSTPGIITRIDYFKIEKNITLYITDYTPLTPTSNN